MIKVESVASFICDNKETNIGKIFNNEQVSESFLNNKIGILNVAIKSPSDKASDLCVKAYNKLVEANCNFKPEDIDCICVCTQNGDYNIPHTSAIVHEKLGFNKNCAVFDISLGCSGYVYSLGIMKSYMEQNGLKKGLLFTSDQYSSILDSNDKNTSLIFGDGASVTLLSESGNYKIGMSDCYTDGSLFDTLIHPADKPLYMDGRMIYNFVMENVPNIINRCITKNGLTQNEIDIYLLHQASKFIVDSLTRRMKLDKEKVPFEIMDYGNTISSSIPIILEKYINRCYNNMLLCGFGVGLSIASVVLSRE